MFKIDLPLVSLWHWLIQSDNREWCAECMCEPEEEMKKNPTCAQTTNSNLRWPVPFVINDLYAGISNRADGFGGVRVLLHRWQKNERKGGGRRGGGRKPSAATCHHVPVLPPLSAVWQAGRQRDRMWSICLCLGNVYAQLSF